MSYLISLDIFHIRFVIQWKLQLQKDLFLVLNADKLKIVQTTRFNHTMIFFKLIDYYKHSDIYMSHNICLGHMLIT